MADVAAAEPAMDGLRVLRLENFRCLQTAEIEPSGSFNLLAGENASGKTSLLEALFFLGRGSSFRAARTELAIRAGEAALTVFGRIERGSGKNRIGVELSREGGLVIQVNGSPRSRADLASEFPVQILDPTSHELIQGPPANRRRFLDWGVFHVEQGFLGSWQRYRRALQQRNAALRAHQGNLAWAWDATLVQAGLEIDGFRRGLTDVLRSEVKILAGELLQESVDINYGAGWRDEATLEEALRDSRQRDQEYGSTQIGPHRADLRVTVQAHRAKDAISRGQEKLLVAALTLAQVRVIQAALGHTVVLLIDEPAADLDRPNLRRLERAVLMASTQVFMTALEPDELDIPKGGRLFHVERGAVRALL